jgi:hypothetical protein
MHTDHQTLMRAEGKGYRGGLEGFDFWKEGNIIKK